MIIRWLSAAMVAKTSELLPEPEMPVKVVSLRLGNSRSTSRRLFSRAPRTRMTSWVSAGWSVGSFARAGVMLLSVRFGTPGSPVWRVGAADASTPGFGVEASA